MIEDKDVTQDKLKFSIWHLPEGIPDAAAVNAAGQANTSMSVHSLKNFIIGNKSRHFLPAILPLGNLKR